MSIDALIKAHIEALNTNTKAVELLTLSLAGRTPAKETKIAKEDVKTVTDLLSAEPVKKKADVTANLVDTDAGVKVVIEETSAAIPYETVRALVLKLAPTQRDAIKALNAKHGIANLKVLLDKEDDFSTVNDQAKLEAVYVDLQALEG
jgi:hypothetical protein